MPDLDLKKISDSLAQAITDYLETFLRVTLKPATTAARLAEELSSNPRRGFQAAITYTIISIVIGLSLGAAVKLPGTPSVASLDIAIGLLFLWVLLGLLLHGALSILGGRGTLTATLAVVLYVLSSVHLLWVPILSLANVLGQQTEVTLTYDYLVMGRGDWTHFEVCIKENEPEEEGTVVPPGGSVQGPRADANATGRPVPKRSERRVLSPEWTFALAIGYYLSMCF